MELINGTESYLKSY